MGLFDFLFGKKKQAAPATYEDDEPVAQPFISIEPDQVEELRIGGARLIDVRSQGEYAGYHVEGAELLPVDQLRRNPGQYLPEDNLIFICEMGGRSAYASQLAASLGHTHVYNVEGGMQAWLSAGLPVAKGLPKA